MWVVKLGGSLAGSDVLRGWLAALDRAGRGRAVVVPGGGPYADAVRTEQRRWGFDDSAAHSMALLAMDQYGHQLAALGNQASPKSFETARTRSDICFALERGAVAVWIGSRMAESDAALPRDWDLTSDSLAAWLAAALGASGLALVKSVQVEGDEISAAALAAREWVDARFPDFVCGARFETRVFGVGQEALLERTLGGAAAGLRVTGYSAAHES
jgi:5-(aminomethyl)-3-furanmethanol phosphate kinase